MIDMIRAWTLFLILFVTGCATSPEASIDAASDAAARAGSGGAPVGPYKIGVDDQIEVKVWQEEALSVSVPVRPDGKISVPLVGEVQAAGKTTDELADTIEAGLTKYLRNPTVTIIVSDLRSNEFVSRVRVTGAVIAPISMPHRRGMTVLDAVLAAGGVNEFAATSETKIYRKAGGQTHVIPVRLDEILARGAISTNVELAPGDIVTVPERFF